MASELELLKSNREELVGKIRFVKPFLDRLLQHGEIVQEEYDIIVAEKTPQDRARGLLDVVAAKGRGAFRHFREHLKKVNPELEEILNRCAKHNLRMKLFCEGCGTMLCRNCRSDDHKDHRCTSLVAEAEAIRREFTAFKRENRKILIERNNTADGYVVANIRREANDRAEALKERLCAKIDAECRWFIKQISDVGVTLSPAQSISSIADSGSVAGSEANVSDCGDQTTTPLSFFSAAKENKELDDDDDEDTRVTEDQTTLCDVDENLDLLEDFSLPFDDNTRNTVIDIQAPKQSATADFLHSFGEFGETTGQFLYPAGLAICPKGKIIVADSWNHRVQLFDINGKWESEMFSTRECGITFPRSVAFRSFPPPGDVIVASPYKGEVLELRLDTMEAYKIKKLQVPECYGIAALDEGNTVVISESVRNTVAVYGRWETRTGNIDYLKIKTFEGRFNKPRNVNTDSQSNVYVSDIGDSTVNILDKNGQLKTTIGKDILRYPTGVCVDKEGNIIVADAAKNTLEIYTSGGHHLGTLIPKEEGLRKPQEVCLTPDGTKLVVVDGGNHRVCVYNYTI
ncbi:E3 ubiquitin-protein ligase TRIM32-like [Branchiostoma lanceolatum]|uniref:E3 ubiquitin-protein ligase TRIM32-like n=1 Tax=Branchiostoma lanceolatum TaxID=7740 RepID=UPI003452AD67